MARNWKRGLFRVWVGLCVLYLPVAIFLSFSLYKSEIEIKPVSVKMPHDVTIKNVPPKTSETELLNKEIKRLENEYPEAKARMDKGFCL